MQDEIIRILFEFAASELYPPQVPSQAERMAVIATGGYGRGLLAPGSDIDLLFILPYKQTAWGESVAEALLYCLWDMGLKVGHATRSVNECIRQAKADMTIRTALLESRYLFGDAELYAELTARFEKEVVQGTAAEFVAAKLAEREERHRRAGQSRYLVEPNVKDGKGGLRDLHTLFWIAKYVYRVREPEELIERGVFDRDEYNMFRRCEDFLVVGPLQHAFPLRPRRGAAVVRHPARYRGAARLHRASRVCKDVERFMKHYFLTAKHVGDLTAILCAGLEERQAKPAPVLSRMIARLRPARSRRTLTETDDFIIDNNRINLARAQCVRARSGQSDPAVLSGAEAQSRHPSRRHARRRALAQADRRQGARRQGGQPAVPGNPDLEERGRNRAAPHERGRRARRIRARLRPHRGDDAVQHVPPLHGGRASVALHRRAQRDRARRQSPRSRSPAS